MVAVFLTSLSGETSLPMTVSYVLMQVVTEYIPTL